MRVLQIEDDAITAMSVEMMLKGEGFTVFSTDLGEEGADLARHEAYDAITLDLTLPDMSGLDVLRQIRAAKVATPVIVVTGQTDVALKVKAFAAGADDFLPKPFHKDELVARLRAMIRRSAGALSEVLTAGPIEIDIGARVVRVAGEPVHLTGREYQMLELLMLRKGVALSKDAFLNHLYGGRDEPELKIIDVFICKVRKKLAARGGDAVGQQIETVWGRGYRISDAAPPRIAKTPVRSLLSPLSVRVLAVLEAGERSFRALADAVEVDDDQALRNTLSNLIAAAKVENARPGVKAGALYRLIPARKAAA